MSDKREFLRSIYEWREKSVDQLDGFEEALKPLCVTKMTKGTLKTKYQATYHIATLNPKVFSAAIHLSDINNLHGWTMKNQGLTGHRCIEILCNNDGKVLLTKCSKEEKKAMNTLAQRGILFLHLKHYCLPLEFLMKSNGVRDDHTWLNICKNMPLDMLKILVPSDIREKMRPSPLAHEFATQMYLSGIKQLATFQAGQFDELAWNFLFNVHIKHDSIKVSDLSKMFDELATSSHHRMSDILLSTKHPILNHLFQMGFIGIEPEQTYRGYYKTAERLVISHEAKEKLQPYWPKQQQRIIDVMKRSLVVDAPKEYQTSIWENDHQLWRMWITLQFVSVNLTQQNSWRIADIKKINKIITDLNQDDIHQLIHAIMLICGEIQERRLHLDMLSSKTIAKKMKKYLFHQSGFESKTKDMQYAAKILCQLPEGKWLDIDSIFTLLSVMNMGKHSVYWEALFKPYIHSPYHFNEDEAVVCLLPHFKAWLQGKDMPLLSPGWRGLEKKAVTTGYISAAGDIQLPPETCADIYADLAPFCHLLSVEHMVNLELDQAAIKALALKPKKLANAKATLERIQSPLPQAVLYLFEQGKNQKVIAKVTATSALVEIKDPSTFNQLNKIGQLSACPNNKNAWLLQPTDSAASFIATCRQQGLNVEGSQDEQQDSATSTAWIEGYYSIRAWVSEFRPENEDGDTWLEIVYQKRRADALKTCYAYYAENNYWTHDMNLRLVKSVRKGLSLAKRATKFDHQHLHKVRVLSKHEVKALNIKDK